MSAISLMLSGIGVNSIGAFQLTKGSIKSGIQSIFLGLSAVNAGGRLYGVDLAKHGEVMKFACVATTGTVQAIGSIQFLKGIKQKDVPEIIKGAVTTATGVAGSLLIHNIDSRIIVAAHQASVIGVASSFIGALGLQDLTQGRYHSGLCKMALAIAGIAGSVLYAYNSFPAVIGDSEEGILACMDSHKGEIEKIYKTYQEVGSWKRLGHGISKVVFTNEECPGWVLKIPRSLYPEDIRKHHKNLEDIRNSARQFDRISLPKSQLYPIADGAVLIEEMFHLEWYNAADDQQEAKKQFDTFVKAVGLCDLHPNIGHNAGILIGSTPPRMGIIDCDCRKD